MLRAASGTLRVRTDRRIGSTLLAAAIIASWLGLAWYRAPAPLPLRGFDQPVYLSIAYDLLHLHRFTDGTEWNTPRPDSARPSGMARMPIYPAFLAITAWLDPSFRLSLNCFVQHSDAPFCPQRAPLPRDLQFVMVVLVYLMLWRLAVRATGSERVGWLTLGVGLLAAPSLTGNINTLMTEGLTLFFTTAATATAVEAAGAQRKGRWILLTGVLLGLAGLTRPAFAYLLPAAAAMGFLIAVARQGLRRSAGMTAIFLLGGAIIVGPWIARNAIIFSRPALTSGYASSVLAQRVAFDLMSWREYGIYYLCVLPDGNGMGSLLIGHDACKPFQYGMQPGMFYDIGNTGLMRSSMAAAGGPQHQLHYLLQHYVLAHPVWHALVSIPMALRGLWIDHYWGFVLAILCVPLTWRAIRDGADAILVATLPGWFMLAFYAGVSPNQTRYNLMLIIPLALAGGITIDRILMRKGWR